MFFLSVGLPLFSIEKKEKDCLPFFRSLKKRRLSSAEMYEETHGRGTRYFTASQHAPKSRARRMYERFLAGNVGSRGFLEGLFRANARVSM
jgi:hypothetical protein